MDPNETLRALRALVGRVNEPDWDAEAMDDADLGSLWASLAMDLAEHIEALDDWLTKGGFPPEAWQGASVAVRPAGQVFAVVRRVGPGPRSYPVIEHPDGRIEEISWGELARMRGGSEPLGGPHPGVNGFPPEEA